MREKDKPVNFREAVRLIDLQRRLLIGARAELSTIEALKSIVRHLNGLSGNQALKIVSGREYREEKKLNNAAETEAASKITLNEIEMILSDTKVSKSKLEAIAIGRFHVPRGSLRSIGKIENLRDKIATLTRNERAHETISSVAQVKKP